MDIILGEEIVRIASDEPRFLYRSGKQLDDERLNGLLWTGGCTKLIEMLERQGGQLR